MRFHFGVSFRLKTLKKFLFPFLIGVLTYFGLGLFGCLPVNAQINTNTYFVFDIPQEDFSQQFYQDKTYQEVLDYYRYYNSPYYNIMVWYNHSRHDIYLNLFSKNYELYKTVAANSTSLSINGNNVSTSNAFSISLFSQTNSNFDNDFTSIVNDCLLNNNCSSTYIGNSFGQFVKNSTNNGVNKNLLSFNSTSFNNDMSYNLENFQVQNYLYYSQVPFYLRYTDISNNYYTKYLIINDNTYGNDSIFPSYINLYDVNYQQYDKNFNYIDNVYIGSIPKNNLTSLNFDFSFNYQDLNTYDSLQPVIYYFGRVDNSTYYSYEKINCSFSNISFDNDISRRYITGSLFNNSLNCSSNLSSYDYIYIYINFFPVNRKLVSNLDLFSNYGNVSSNNSNAKNLFIYEKFVNLPSDYSFMLSTEDFSSNIFYNYSNNSSDNFSVLTPYYPKKDFFENKNINPLMIGSYNMSNGFLFNNTNLYNSTTNIDLYFDYDIILSPGVNGSYTYYDFQHFGLPTTNIVKNDYIIYSDNSFNINYIFNDINNYINGLNLPILAFSSLTQSFWDNLDDNLQDFIVVVFIFSCVYFIYILIRK